MPIDPQSNDVTDAIQDAVYLVGRAKDINSITNSLVSQGHGRKVSRIAAEMIVSDNRNDAEYVQYVQSLNKNRLINIGIAILLVISLCLLFVYFVNP